MLKGETVPGIKAAVHPPFFCLPLFVRGGTNKSRQSAVSFRQQPDHCFGHLLFQGFEVQSVVCKC